MHLDPAADKRYAFILRLTISLCFFSSAYQFYHFSNSTFSWFFVELEFEESQCQTIVQVGIALLLIAIGFTWTKRFAFLSLLGTGVLLLESIAYMNHTSEDDAYQHIISNGLKIFLPLALSLYQFNGHAWSLRLSKWLIAMAFVGHGLRALFDYPIYIDYLHQFFRTIHVSLYPSTILMVLHAIGTIDLALSHHACFYNAMRIKWVFLYMALWGLITAFARVLFSGWGAWHEVMIRAPHYLVPFVLYLMIVRVQKNRLA